LFPTYFPKIGKLEKDQSKSAYADIIDWFENEPGLELLDDATDVEYKKELDSVKPLNELIKKYQPETSKEDTYFLKEFVLWALVEYKKLSKDRFVEGFQFSDLFTR
jgi:magnesium chelatase subunit I